MINSDLHVDVVIVGLGKTGLSCVRYLAEKNLSLAVTDSRIEPPELTEFKNKFEKIPVYLGEINIELLLSAEQIILSPGVSLETDEIKQAIDVGIPVYGDIELFCQQASAPIIAISGSNGKSTVTSLVAEMARQAGLNIRVGGNFGTPALDLLNDDVPDFYILELSSFQLETTFSLNAFASAVLNVSPDHMDRYNNLEDYSSAKKKIYSGNGLCVINLDDPVVKAMSDPSRRNLFITLSRPDAENFGLILENNDLWLCQGTKKIIKQDQIRIKGEHNILNALAATALASSMGISHKDMAVVLMEFSGLDHRCQLVKTFNEVSWYNDSKATNVGACIASIKGLGSAGKIILIAGGDSKDADLTALVPVIKKYVRHVLLLGKDANKLAKAIGTSVPYENVMDMDEAVQKANKIAIAGETVLLAPACASLDMYENYQQRGEFFVSAVNALVTN